MFCQSDLNKRFRDRTDAGRQLATQLRSYARENCIVLGLPRGGVPVAYEVANILQMPLDIWVVRKIGVPWHQELGMGAAAEGGFVHLTPEVIYDAEISETQLRDLIAEKQKEVEARVRTFRGHHKSPDLAGRTVILVDDGIATGGTMRAAIDSIRHAGAKKIVLAVPVAQTQILQSLRERVDDIVCIISTPNLYAVGVWYENFAQVSDDEVIRILKKHNTDVTTPSLLANSL